MRKFKFIMPMLAVIAAVLLAVGTSSFKNSKEKGKQTLVYYRFDGSPSEFEDETKWVQISNPASLGCEGEGNICWMEYYDQGGSDNPPTLPSGFDPTDFLHDTKN